VQLQTCCCKGEYALDCVFYEFLAVMSDGSAIVVHELGACRIEQGGEFVWNQPTGVVTDYRDAGSVVVVTTDGGEIHIDKESGTRL
jgi:hypothetical protein